MYRIVEKVKLTPNAYRYTIQAPRVSKKAKPGQFVILRVHEKGERIPITITDSDPEKGTIDIIFAEVGKTSQLLGALEEGGDILNLSGPLGNETKIENYGKILCVGGGVMVGALHYQMEALKEAGNSISTIVGARSKEHLFMVEELDKLSDSLTVATDDGSQGYSNLDFMDELLEKEKFDHVIAIGPTSMQWMISNITKEHHIPMTVNLFPIMVDGTGMCGACRVTVGEETKFACVDGPDFDGHKVDFEELVSRMRFYNPNEKIAMVLFDGR